MDIFDPKKHQEKFMAHLWIFLTQKNTKKNLWLIDGHL